MKNARHILGLNVEEVDTDELKRNPAGIDGVELPLLALPSPIDGDWVDLALYGKGSLDGKVHNHQTLGAEFEGQNLHGVGH